jgi:uroporphyrinogen III methyltransferase/synthase
LASDGGGSEASGDTGTVYLVGAGPGDPRLITVRGRDLLDVADVVVYDALANPRLLPERPNLERLYVGKKASAHAATQDQINALLIERARQGKTVVRLKGGDPFVFGRGGEECEALAAAGVPFEVVPGITAGIGALAYAGIPITHRDLNSGFTIVTGHEKEETYQDAAAAERSRSPDRAAASDLDWSALARMPCVVFYMGVKALPRIVERLVAAGLDPHTPAATVQWGTLPTQRTVVATVGTIVEQVRVAGLGAPAVTVVGRVVQLRRAIDWFETKPLFGQTVVVTRTRQQASELVDRLESLGADVRVAPTIEIVPADSDADLRDALRGADTFDWLLFTSVNGPAALKRWIVERGDASLDLRRLAWVKVGVVGGATAKACRDELGICPDVIAETASAEGLAESLEAIRAIEGRRFLLLRADLARPLLVDRLRAGGAGDVRDVALYETRVAAALPDDVLELLDRGRVTWITFASSSSVDNLVALLGERATQRLAGVRLASIGPLTSASIHARGFEVSAQAGEASVASLVRAVVATTSKEQR